MFKYCGLTSLDLNSFNTSNVTNMGLMFEGCKNLTTLDLSNWDMTNVTTITWMFESCKNLTTIKVTNCSNNTISKLQEALTDAGYSSTVSNGIITVIH
jgi:surface protein